MSNVNFRVRVSCPVSGRHPRGRRKDEEERRNAEGWKGEELRHQSLSVNDFLSWFPNSRLGTRLHWKLRFPQTHQRANGVCSAFPDRDPGTRAMHHPEGRLPFLSPPFRLVPIRKCRFEPVSSFRRRPESRFPKLSGCRIRSGMTEISHFRMDARLRGGREGLRFSDPQRQH